MLELALEVNFFELIIWNLCSLLTVSAANIGQSSVIQDMEKQTFR